MYSLRVTEQVFPVASKKYTPSNFSSHRADGLKTLARSQRGACRMADDDGVKWDGLFGLILDERMSLLLPVVQIHDDDRDVGEPNIFELLC